MQQPGPGGREAAAARMEFALCSLNQNLKLETATAGHSHEENANQPGANLDQPQTHPGQTRNPPRTNRKPTANQPQATATQPKLKHLRDSRTPAVRNDCQPTAKPIGAPPTSKCRASATRARVSHETYRSAAIQLRTHRVPVAHQPRRSNRPALRKPRAAWATASLVQGWSKAGPRLVLCRFVVVSQLFCYCAAGSRLARCTFAIGSGVVRVGSGLIYD